MQNVDLQVLLGHDLLQALVLELELTETHELVGLHLAVFLAPGVIGLRGDVKVPAGLVDGFARLRHRLDVAQIAKYLLGLSVLGFHR